MPAAKRPASKKLTKTKRASSGSGKLQNTRKIILPTIETTALERSLEPDNPKGKIQKKKKTKTPRPSLDLPNFIAFTVEVWRTIWQYKSTFWRLVVLYALLSGVFVGIASQDVYSQLSSILRQMGGEVLRGDASKFGEVGEVLLTSLTGAANPAIGEAQQFIGGLLVLIVWLTTVWLLRAFLAGHNPQLRDGFYNSGAPLVPTFLLSFLLVIQLIPAAIAVIVMAAAIPTGFINGGVMLLLFWIVALLLIGLSLFWATSTFMALIVVTLPGMYPMKALRSARELVAGRRLRIVLRMLWLVVLSMFFWTLVMVLVILFDAWVKGVWQAIEEVPLVPIAFLFASSSTVVWMASYTYLFYRKVVDNDGTAA